MFLLHYWHNVFITVCFWINIPCPSLKYLQENLSWWWSHTTSAASTPKMDINYRILILFQHCRNSVVTILGILTGFVHVSFACLCSTESLLIVCGNIHQEVRTRDVEERVFGRWWGKKGSSMLGTDPYSRIDCHSIPNWRRTCMHKAREADLTL